MGRVLIQQPGTNTAKALTETLPKNVIIVDEDLKELRLHDGVTPGGKIIGQSAGSGVPIGTIIPFAGNSIPQGYLLCDGSAISRTNYASLFAVIGTIYGAGDGSTTFNLPDLSNRVPMKRQGSTLGYKEAGYIPNITASVDGVPNVGATIYRDATGAFDLGSTYHFLSSKGSATTDTFILKFNASRSSSIYANVDGVYPKNLAIFGYLIKY